MWQDVVIAWVVLVFTLTTIPMIRHRTVLPKTTTLPMIAGAVVLTGTYATLDLWYSVTVEAAAAFLWLILAWRSATLQADG